MRLLPFEQLPVPAVPCTVLLDVDGTLVPDRSEDLTDEVAAAVAKWNETHRVLLCSNSPNRARIQRLAGRLGCGVGNGRYRKPDRRVLQEAGNPAGPILVVGDRTLTDGIFAWRIGAAFTRTLPRRVARERLGARVAYLVDDLASAILAPVLRWPTV